MLRASDNRESAERIVREAIRNADDRRLPIAQGRLAATLAATLRTLEQYEEALQVCRLYLERAKDPDEEAELSAVMATIHAVRLDEKGFREAVAPLSSRWATLTPIVRGTIKQNEALLKARLGDHAAASKALSELSVYAKAERTLLESSFPLIAGLVRLHHFGFSGAAASAEDAMEPLGLTPMVGKTQMSLLADLSRGYWDAAVQRLKETNLERLSVAEQAELLTMVAPIRALSDFEADLPDVATLLRKGMATGYRSGIAQLAAWWAVGSARNGSPISNELMDYVRDAFDRAPASADIGVLPISVALFAESANDRGTLERIADGAVTGSRWLVSQRLFARGYALRALGRRSGSGLLGQAAEQLRELGADFFASLANAFAGAPSPQDANLLAGLAAQPRVSMMAPATRQRPARRSISVPTPREREVANLVSEGRTNREIAHALFLSERTVEVHVANLFSKVDVSSRAQLTRWVLENPQFLMGANR
ncbi:MAG: response regulator transcription factor [Candidatus Eremiobacteraeota bacterium]|nr:response regulator transcription factor [Candidatus Eremiobacteraeota bacterium]